MFKYILLGFTIYFAYRFLFDFLLPVIRTTRQVRKQFEAAREQQQGFKQRAEPQHKSATSSKTKKAASDDYLDFEEVK